MGCRKGAASMLLFRLRAQQIDHDGFNVALDLAEPIARRRAFIASMDLFHALITADEDRRRIRAEFDELRQRACNLAIIGSPDVEDGERNSILLLEDVDLPSVASVIAGVFVGETDDLQSLRVVLV